MYLAYIDESGDTGYSQKSSKFYILAGIVIPDTQWENFHLQVKGLISTTIKNYCLSKNVKEIHFKEFKNGNHKWQKSNLGNYYSDLSNFLKTFPDIYTFSVIFDKRKVKKPSAWALPHQAIKFLAERISHFAINHCKNHPDRALIVVDNSSLGLHASWRKTIGELKASGNIYNKSSLFLNGIIEEALFVDSKVSPEIQVADSIAGFTLVDYANSRIPNLKSMFNFYSPKGNADGWGIKIWP